jgi:hypothetical protein
MRTIARMCLILAVIGLGFTPRHIPAGASAILRGEGASPGPRSGHSLVYDSARRRLVLVDGYRPPHDSSPAELWTWDGRGWERVPGSGSGPSKRIVGAAAYDVRRDRIVSFGGSHSSGGWEWDGTGWMPAK